MPNVLPKRAQPATTSFPIITDLNVVKRQAQEREDENYRFRAWVKGEWVWKSSQIDDFVRTTTDEVWQHVDCTTCANCCRGLSVVVDDEDIARLARRLEIPVDTFMENYVREDDGDRCLISQPCVFLKDNLCSVYEDRPKVCRDFPFLHQEGFSHRLLAMIERAETCPIVFNTLESLKRKLHWRRTHGS